MNEPLTPTVAEAPVVQDTSAQDVIDRAADVAQEVAVPSATEPAPEVEAQQVEAPVAAEPVAAEPVVEEPSERTPSLREKMTAANSVEELDKLVALGASDKYKFAASKTRNRWATAAKLRRAELKGTPSNG